MGKGRQSGMPDASTWGAFFEPDRMLAALDCPQTGDVVEFGCGYGLFSIAAAKRTTGVVYALDIDPMMVQATAARAADAAVDNIVVQQRDFLVDGCGRPDASLAYAMLFNILHIEEPGRLLAQAFRALAPGGRLAIAHWRSDIITPRGPSLDIRPTLPQSRTWAEQAGFRFLHGSNLPCSDWHWGMVVQR